MENRLWVNTVQEGLHCGFSQQTISFCNTYCWSTCHPHQSLEICQHVTRRCPSTAHEELDPSMQRSGKMGDSWWRDILAHKQSAWPRQRAQRWFFCRRRKMVLWEDAGVWQGGGWRSWGPLLLASVVPVKWGPSSPAGGTWGRECWGQFEKKENLNLAKCGMYMQGLPKVKFSLITSTAYWASEFCTLTLEERHWLGILSFICHLQRAELYTNARVVSVCWATAIANLLLSHPQILFKIFYPICHFVLSFLWNTPRQHLHPSLFCC